MPISENVDKRADQYAKALETWQARLGGTPPTPKAEVGLLQELLKKVMYGRPDTKNQ